MQLLPTEHQIQSALINYLRIKGFYCLRLNSGKFAVGEGRQRRFIKGQEAGTPDLLAFKEITVPASIAHMLIIKKTCLLFIEVKRPGRKPTPLQKAKMEELRSYGATCIVASCIEDLKPYL